jgi:hypothetical protein
LSPDLVWQTLTPFQDLPVPRDKWMQLYAAYSTTYENSNDRQSAASVPVFTCLGFNVSFISIFLQISSKVHLAGFFAFIQNLTSFLVLQTKVIIHHCDPKHFTGQKLCLPNC